MESVGLPLGQHGVDGQTAVSVADVGDNEVAVHHVVLLGAGAACQVEVVLHRCSLFLIVVSPVKGLAGWRGLYFYLHHCLSELVFPAVELTAAVLVLALYPADGLLDDVVNYFCGDSVFHISIVFYVQVVLLGFAIDGAGHPAEFFGGLLCAEVVAGECLFQHHAFCQIVVYLDEDFLNRGDVAHVDGHRARRGVEAEQSVGLHCLEVYRLVAFLHHGLLLYGVVDDVGIFPHSSCNISVQR